MHNVSLTAWPLILSAIAALGTLVTGTLFFTVGGTWGPINDATSVVQMILTGVAAVGLHAVVRPNRPLLALVALVPGLVGFLAIAVMQALLVIKKVQFEQTFVAVLACGTGIGLWLALTSANLSAASLAPAPHVALGVVSGVAYCLPFVLYVTVGQEHPAFYVGSLVGVLGYAGWAIWLSRLV